MKTRVWIDMRRMSTCDFASAFGLKPDENLRDSADKHLHVSSRSNDTQFTLMLYNNKLKSPRAE